MAKKEPAFQVAALCYRRRKKKIEILLVKSLGRGNWILPKGWPMDDRSPAKAAAAEAFEEAGLIGQAWDQPIGTYRTPKIRPPLIWTVEVNLYPMPIDVVLDDWQEIHQRERRFVTMDEARDLLSQPEMIELAEQFWATRQDVN